MIFSSAVSIHGIKNNVRVNMLCINVSSNNTFKSAERFLRKLNSNSVSELRLNFISAWVRLYEMIVLDTSCFSVHLTGVFELLIHCRQRTIECCDIFLIVCLIITTDIFNRCFTSTAAFGTDCSYSCHYFTALNSSPIIVVTLVCSSRSGWKFTIVSLSILARVAI